MFLVDGTPSGLITAEIMNWTGHVLVMPRSRLGEALKREEATKTGVYFLIGEDPEDPSQPMLYIGEGDNVRKRIKAHAEDENKEFWTRACLVTSKDRNLTKAHVRYLEGRLIEVAKQADRARLTNSTNPDVGHLLPESDMSDMEHFVSQIKIIFPVIGIDFLRSKPSPNDNHSDLRDSDAEEISATLKLVLDSPKHGYVACALERYGELTVLQGSTALAHPKHIGKGYAALRERLKESGVLQIKEGNPSLLEFRENYTFKSPSAAASVINGRNSNGRTDWVLKESGISLKEHQDTELVRAFADLNIDMSSLLE